MSIVTEVSSTSGTCDDAGWCRASLKVAGEICIYTNDRLTVEVL
jgi:ATP-dependent protease HslVU (ClpYQ) peptidase subunit